jgi:hypothetical protein
MKRVLQKRRVQNEGSKKGVQKQEKKGQKKKGKKPEILFPPEPTFSPLGGSKKHESSKNPRAAFHRGKRVFLT